jgi:hypothetical protein
MSHRRAILAAAVLSGLTAALHAQVNGYAEVTSIAGTTLTIGMVNEAFDSFEDGRQAILMQVQDDVVGPNVLNNAAFGDLSVLTSAGMWEVVTVATHAEVGSVPVSITVALPLTHVFHFGPKSAVQLITFPERGTPDYTTSAPMNALPWNGILGGVVCFQVSGTLTLANDIRADGAGFRGGVPSSDFDGACMPFTYAASIANYGEKGDGVQRNGDPNIQYARGKFANGAGGGNPDNAGGGGGSNVTVGGGGGGGYGCLAGGLPGVDLLAYIMQDRFFMGGSGGGGQQNNSVGGAGGAGGGIVIVSMNTLRTVGPCAGGLFISANGANGQSSVGAPPDGAGGGGAGGSVYLIVNAFNIDPTCSVTCQANGGNGGGVTNTDPFPGNWVDCGGGGGGGGQGLVMCGGGMGGNGGSGWGGMSGGTASGNGGTHDPGGGHAPDSPGSDGAGVMGFPGGPALPVELLSFTGRAMADGVRLEWSTATEHNSEGFKVQRSRDAIVWEHVAHVPAVGESQSTIHYDALDADPLDGLAFYRLEQYDLDGAAEVFPMIAVEWNGPAIISVHPNPANDLLTFTGAAGPLTVTLTDPLGRRALQVSLTSEDRTIALDGVVNGAYLVTVSGAAGELLRTTVIVHR